MTVIVPKINPRSSVEKIVSQPKRLEQSTEGASDGEWEESSETNELVNVPQSLNETTTFTATLKNTSESISMVFSKNKGKKKKEDSSMAKYDSIIPGSGVRVMSRGRRRSVDKQYKPSQPTSNSGGSRGSTRRSGRSYQNYDNNSSNGNSGADGNGEDNDDSDDDDDDEYIDEDDDDDDEEEEEEEEDDDDDKNDEDDEDESSSGREKANSVVDSIDEKVLSAFDIKGSDDSSVVVMNSGSSETILAPAPSGTPVTLQGIICHETMGGVLVVNIKWRNKVYCGSLMDCTRHSWARPRFQSSDSSNQGKTRMGKNNERGKGKGRGKRLRSNSVTSNNSNNHTVSPLKQKLRGRKKTISGSSTDKRQGFRASKRKAKNNDDDSDDSLRPGKRSCTIKGAPSPQPSPTLIECPEPGCEKKYKHINGLRYHQAHAHLESKNQYDDANSDDRSSTTPSPSDEFKEPDPRTTTKGRATSNSSSRNRSESPSITQDKASSNTDKDISTTENINEKPKNEPIKCKGEPANSWDAELEKKQDANEIVDEKVKEDENDKENNNKENDDSKSNISDESENPEDNGKVYSEKTENNGGEGEFVEVADKSTDTRMISPSEEVTSYSCEKHSVITIETVLPASEVPEVADTQEVWETVLDSGCSSNNKYEETGSVNLDDVIGSQGDAMGESTNVGRIEIDKESEMVSVYDPKDEKRQILLTTSSINQLGIEVEDISENEEDIDPGQDTEFNSREEMEKAVENLQNGSFVASMSTENNLQMLSSLKDPSLIFGLTNRDKSNEESAIENSRELVRTEDLFTAFSRSKQITNEDFNQTSENSLDSEVEIATRPLLGMSSFNRDETMSTESAQPTSVNSKLELENLEKPISCSPQSMSVEKLVSRSISVSKLQPPLTNTDTPSNRFKYFTCRSYGDETYTQTASNITSTSTAATLALIRDPELLKKDTVPEGITSVNTDVPQNTLRINPQKDPVESLVENVGPSYTGPAGFNRDCTTSSIHTRGPKEEHKGENSTGDIIRSTSYGSLGNPVPEKQRVGSGRDELSSKVSYSSPKSSIAATTTTYNLQQYPSKPEETTNIKKKSEEECSFNDFNPAMNFEKERSEMQKETKVPNIHLECSTIDDGKKEEDKPSSRMFPRQPPTLIPKHSRPTAPTLPVGVAHPYQYSTVATSAAVTTGLSVTSPGRQDSCRPDPVCHNTPSKPDEKTENKAPSLKKVVTEKAHPIPVGEVGPVAVKRPAIHAGLPTVIPVGVPLLKGQGSLHASIRQGLKPPGQEDRASTPGGLSSRLSASSPRSLQSSPRPLSTSPRLPITPKASTSEIKTVTTKESITSSSEKPVRDDVTKEDADVVIVKQEDQPASEKASSVDAEKAKERKRSPYQPMKDQLSHEKYMYHFHQQRQMYQAEIELAYFQSLGRDIQSLASPWAMSPEQLKLLQQHYCMRAEEESRELHASKNPREDPNKLRITNSTSPLEKRQPDQPVRSTPPRPERPRLITGIPPPGEVSRTSTSDVSNRGMPQLTQGEEPPEKKSRGEYSKTDETERELQKLRHKRQEELLYKQSMQQKFTMYKQLENAGGAAKTHSIPPLTSTNKDRHTERDDYPKSKFPQRSSHSDALQTRKQENNKATKLSLSNDSVEPNLSDLSSRTRDISRDTTRDTHLKPSTKHTWTSSSSSRHSDTPPGERSASSSTSSFRPTQFQAYLQHNQMIEQINYDPATGNPVMMQAPIGVMPPQLSMDLGGVMNLSSPSVITSSPSTPTSVPSRLKDRDRSSPYRGASADQSPSSPHTRPSRSRSPSRSSSPILSSQSKTSYSRNNERPRSPSSQVQRSPYKTPERAPASSPSIVPRNSYRSVSPGSHIHRSTDRMSSSSTTVVSRSSHRSSDRSLSPPIHGHKDSYRVPTSSPSRSSVLSRMERSNSPPRGQSEYRYKQRSEASSNVLSSESSSKPKTSHDEAGYRSQERLHDSEAALMRPGIISNNLAVRRRQDVTPGMLMAAHHSQEEELIRRHQYMLYVQRQEQAAAYAMMSSNQQKASRSDPYYGKRQ